MLEENELRKPVTAPVVFNIPAFPVERIYVR